MGLIKTATGVLRGVVSDIAADQWREYFYCDALPADVLVTKGRKRTSKRSVNTKGGDNIISNGSIIAIAEGQCMIIVEQGRVVDVCAEAGEYTYDMSTEPSIFYGDLGENIVNTFKNIGRRFTFGGETPKDQRVYYFNTKEILDNKFGTPTPIIFEVVNKNINMRRTVNLRFNGVFTYAISDPLLFYARLCGNVEQDYTRDQIDGQLKADFMDALQPAVGVLAEQELRPAQIPAKARELKTAMNIELQSEWGARGVTIQNISLNPITLNPEDMQKIQEMEDVATLGSSASMMAGRMADATATAMNTAAGNTAGAMTGFLGMGMAGGAMGGGFNAAQNLFAMGQQQQQQQAAPAGGGLNAAQNLFSMGQQKQQAPQHTPQQAAPAAGGWTCACGTAVNGNFCPNCGSKKPSPKPAANGWKCPKCGASANGNFCPECGTKKPAEEAGWTCACGTVNKGKFCPNCGARKPAEAPRYRCDKCGWEPKDPRNPPKFCPECGDPFDDNDKR